MKVKRLFGYAKVRYRGLRKNIVKGGGKVDHLDGLTA